MKSIDQKYQQAHINSLIIAHLVRTTLSTTIPPTERIIKTIWRYFESSSSIENMTPARSRTIKY
jgi:hypothetical protein